jgi:hypothetical protein
LLTCPFAARAEFLEFPGQWPEGVFWYFTANLFSEHCCTDFGAVEVTIYSGRPAAIMAWLMELPQPALSEANATVDIMVPGRSPRTPTSTVLDELLGAAPAEAVTLGWLVGRLGPRSFGIVLLLLGLLGLLPGICVLAAILLLVAAFEMALANRRPVFTRRLATLRFPTRRLASLIRRAAPVLKYLERFIRPRWPTPFEATKRIVGMIVLLLGLCMLMPIPFGNVPPAILIMIIAFAYLEEDGALLCVASAAALLMLVALGAIVWQTIILAGRLPRLL